MIKIQAMKKNISIALFCFCLATVFAACSCKRTLDDAEFQGKEIVSAPADFTGTVAPFSATRKQDANYYPLVDTNGTQDLYFGQILQYQNYVIYAATLSHRVTWTITITGNLSGATKTITGTSQIIDNTNATWDGRSDGTYFFRHDESFKAVLSFLNSDITYTHYGKIKETDLGPYNYTEHPVSVKKFILVDDFDAESNPYKTRTTYSDVNDGADKAKFIVSNKLRMNELFSMYMKGTDGNGNGYLGGFSNQDLVELANAVTTEDPDSVYINAYVYGYGRPNTALMFLLYESDTNTPPYKGIRDDNYQYIQEITWTGWKLVSIKYSAFKASSNPAAGGSGNRIKEPKKLVGIGAELQCYPTPGLTVETNVDFFSITTGGPFVQ